MAAIYVDMVLSWLESHEDEIKQEAERHDLSPTQFILLMFNDALEAYKNGRIKEPI